MSPLLFLVVCAFVFAAVVIGLWLADVLRGPSSQVQPDPLAEALALRVELHEIAHETRVEMLRATRKAAQDHGA